MGKKLTITNSDSCREIPAGFQFLIDDFAYRLVEQKSISYESWTIYENGNRGVDIRSEGNGKPYVTLYEVDSSGNKHPFGVDALTSENVSSYYKSGSISLRSNEHYLAGLRRYIAEGADLLKKYAVEHLSGTKSYIQLLAKNQKAITRVIHEAFEFLVADFGYRLKKAPRQSSADGKQSVYENGNRGVMIRHEDIDITLYEWDVSDRKHYFHLSDVDLTENLLNLFNQMQRVSVESHERYLESVTAVAKEMAKLLKLRFSHYLDGSKSCSDPGAWTLNWYTSQS